ncbi:D-erythrulose kinase, partial [Burkholderia multivorans]|uniref:DAK2 domain-containing protein n=1 Tax=Burkholderia multivorans TaxID=87883 RepID=UPI000DB11369
LPETVSPEAHPQEPAHGGTSPDAAGPAVARPAPETSRRLRREVASVLAAIAALLDESAAELGRLDSIAGDGDHGIGMQRGSQAAAPEAASASSHDQGPAVILRAAGEAWADVGGGTSGAIWG